MKFKDENDSYKYSDIFHKELSKYIKRRIKELKIILNK